MIKRPEHGDIINPDGDMMINTGEGAWMVNRGVVILPYDKALIAMRYGWKVVNMDRHRMTVHKPA